MTPLDPATPARPIRTGAEYIESLRGRNLAVYLLGERVAEPVDYPIIRQQYVVSVRQEELTRGVSMLDGGTKNFRIIQKIKAPKSLVK